VNFAAWTLRRAGVSWTAGRRPAIMDKTTFTQLWQQSKPAVEAFLASLVNDHAAVDDLTQEVVMAVYQQIDRYDEQRAFTPWVIAIARNKAYEYLRRRSARQRIMSQASVEKLADAAICLEPELGARELALEACMQDLPERSRRLLHQHYGENRDLATIAEQNRLSLANVKVILHRIRSALKACIEKRLATGTAS
jgi:RNA polymerase sigma-70 factor (ECF subfamily)